MQSAQVICCPAAAPGQIAWREPARRVARAAPSRHGSVSPGHPGGPPRPTTGLPRPNGPPEQQHRRHPIWRAIRGCRRPPAYRRVAPRAAPRAGATDRHFHPPQRRSPSARPWLPAAIWTSAGPGVVAERPVHPESVAPSPASRAPRRPTPQQHLLHGSSWRSSRCFPATNSIACPTLRGGDPAAPTRHIHRASPLICQRGLIPKVICASPAMIRRVGRARARARNPAAWPHGHPPPPSPRGDFAPRRRHRGTPQPARRSPVRSP